MYQHDPYFACAAGNRTHDVCFVILHLNQSFDQLNHAKDQRCCQSHQHGGDTVPPNTNKDN